MFKKFDPNGQDKIEQKNFYPLFMELLKIYNDQIEQENKATENEQIPQSQNEESKQSQT